MTRRRKILLSTLLVITASIAAAFYTVLASEAGLRWLVDRVIARVPGTLTVATVRGELGGPIELQDIQYRHEDLELRVRRVGLEWNLWGIFAGVLRVNRLAVSDVDIRSTPAPDSAPITLPEISLPFRLSVGDLAVNNVRTYFGADASPVEVSSVALEGALFASTLTLDRFDIAVPNATLSLTGRIKTNAQYPMELDTRWTAQAGEHAVRGRGKVSGDMARLNLAQDIESPVAAAVKLTLVDVLTAPRWEASVDARGLLPTTLIPDWPLDAADVAVVAHGGTTQAQGTVTLRSAHAVTGKFELSAELGYDAMRVKIASLTAQLLDSDTRVQARGEIALNPASPNSIEHAELNGGWQQLRWPLRDAPVVMSREGTFQLDGNLDKYAFEARAPLVGEAVPPGDWVVRGAGDAQHVTLDEISVATLGGTVHAAGNARWSPSVNWTLDATADRINPATQWPEWPGNIAAQLHHQGALDDGRARGRVEITKLDGRLRGYPFNGRLIGTMDGDAFRAETAVLRSGDATVSLSGGVDRDWNIDVTLRAPKLAALFPDARGSLNTDVRVRGPREQPRAQVKWSAEKLKVRDAAIDHAGGDADLDWNSAAQSRLIFKAEGMAFGEWRAAELRINGDGTLAQHRLIAELTAPDGGASVEIKGVLREGAWNGELARADVKHPRVGGWTLQQPMRIEADARHANVARGCWHGQDDSVCIGGAWKADDFASVDVQLDRIPAALLKSYLPERVSITGQMSGTLRAHYALAAPPARALDAEMAFKVGAGELTVTDATEDSVRIAYGGVELSARVDAQGLRSTTRFDFGALGDINAQIELANWHPRADTSTQSVGGRVRLEVNDLSLVSHLSAALDDARGTLRADVELGGTLSNPQLNGTAKLVDGAVAIPQIGIKLSGITMEANNTPENMIRFVARGSSGPGSVELRGEFVPDKERGWPVVMEITGKNFEAVNLPEARVLASPDLQLRIVRNRIDLNGVLTIPEARYSARDTSEAVTPSNDVVVVGKNEKPAHEEKWQVYSAVRFVFGDKVTFNGFGLKGKVRGEVVALEEPKKITTGYGELQIVDASFNAYKIDLKVTRGRLTFAGGPINNPGIDARAVREAGTIRDAAKKNDKEDLREPGGIVVGALVRGTLRKLELTLFSDPPRDQADVLSLLLFGVPLGEATTEEGKALFIAASTLRLSGGDDTVRKIGRRFGIDEVRLETGSTPEQAALVLGRYLGPRLYVNYSVGLLSTTANVLRVRYRISDKWTLQSEQSDAESAADLLYTFEH